MQRTITILLIFALVAGTLACSSGSRKEKGAAGAYIGDYVDKQAAEIERYIQGARVERIGEGIKITFDSGILFDVDRATLKGPSKQELAELAVILNKYEARENPGFIVVDGIT